MVPPVYVAGKTLPCASDTCCTMGWFVKVIATGVVLVTTAAVNVISTNSCLPAGKVEPVGSASATPSLPVLVWLSFTNSVPPAPFARIVLTYVRRAVLKFRLKLNAFSVPLALSSTGTVTVPPEAALASATRSTVGPGFTVRTALLLTIEPIEFVTSTE